MNTDSYSTNTATAGLSELINVPNNTLSPKSASQSVRFAASIPAQAVNNKKKKKPSHNKENQMENTTAPLTLAELTSHTTVLS
jgi:hypothetical protein